MSGMILHTRQPLDDRGHPRQGPKVGSESVRARPLAQRPVHQLQLLAVQLRFAARATGRSQGWHTALSPLSVPAADTLAANPQKASHRGENLASAEQLGGLLSAIFQGLEISSGTHRRLHASIMHEVLRFVTIFCETH